MRHVFLINDSSNAVPIGFCKAIIVGGVHCFLSNCLDCLAVNGMAM